MFNFETPSVQAELEQNPAAFFKKYADGAIFDEVQRVPIVFRYLQEILDNNRKRGQFILTGANNFLLQEQVAQSLAGRAGYLSLLPMSFGELTDAKKIYDNADDYILKGGYPEIWNENIHPDIWMQSYVQTYVQRDVRLLKNINDLAAFTRFIYLCASAAGQLLNRDELARNTGVDNKTILSWLGLLENSYLVYLMQPWHNNTNKRMIKSPKLYFYDTALLCFLLGISNKSNLRKHPQYGAIFENWIITEIKKNRLNAGVNDDVFFIRDSAGNEIDLVLYKNMELFGIEIKAAKKIDGSMLQGLKYWQKNQPHSNNVLIYGGNKDYEINFRQHAFPWNQIDQF